MRVPHLTLTRLVLVAFLPTLGGAVKTRSAAPIASIRLFNPTRSNEPATVEIPVGQLGNPKLVDWQNVHLVHDGKPIPFALREGKARWRAALSAPLTAPRAEDLLVFSVRVPPGSWTQVQLRSGAQAEASALVRRSGMIMVTYPEIRALIDEQTGLLTTLSLHGELILGHPLDLRFVAVDEGVATFEKRMGPGYSRTPAELKKVGVLPTSRVQLVSSSSNAALTEINFVLQSEGSAEIGLTYRFYANSEVEISADGRPWTGTSPWLKAGLEIELALAGKAEPLGDFQTNFPVYGFRDYPAAVRGIGTLHRRQKTLAFELGEESINGRFWHRRLALFQQQNTNARPEALLELLDEGLVVDVAPMTSRVIWQPLRVEFAPELDAIGGMLRADLAKAGIRVDAAAERGAPKRIRLTLAGDAARYGISGDGFAIEPASQPGRIEVVAGTRFGLLRAASEIRRHLRMHRTHALPFIAENPVVDLRAGGFGGAGHEVDFPYGSEAHWQHAFDGMMKNGMNVMTDLGMWGNWKMPVFFKYMPELQTTAADAHDEVTGANFSDFAKHRAHSLRLLEYLHARGVKVWLWMPVGTLPTTFHERFPEATVPGNNKIPRFMHPKYRQLLDAYFKELLEVYPVDGFVLIRDDNGGVDQTDEFKEYLRGSRTKHPVWEQYLIIYDLLRAKNFKGQIAVYPYFDVYEPRLETLLPSDLLIVGHGSGLGVLTRDFNTVAPMGDTWLDNLYASFRLPTASKMKRLLGDRSSYWIGGAYEGTELPWEAVGFFGWQPTATVNTLRYQFGARMFGRAQALKFVRFSDAYEELWDLMNVPLLPYNWLARSTTERDAIAGASRRALTTYRQKLDRLQAVTDQRAHASWFAHVNHYEEYFTYWFRRVELYGRMHDMVAARRTAAGSPGHLPEAVRQRLIVMQREILLLAKRYERQAAQVPGNMMADARKLGITSPFNEMDYAGFDEGLDNAPGTKVREFDGEIHVRQPALQSGQPFELEIELINRGVVPWIAGAGHAILLEGDAPRLGLPERWNFEGEPMVFGDRRKIAIRGVVPTQLDTATINVGFLTSERGRVAFGQVVEIK